MQTTDGWGPVAALTINGISKKFGQTPVLSDVSVDIQDGEFLSLVGPSGCGKTTLLRIIAGLDHADTGDIRIGSQVVDDLAPKARDVAMVFQSYALYPYMTVRENMALPLQMRELTRAQRAPFVGRWLPGAAQARQRVAEHVEKVAEPLGLLKLLDRRPAQLSGGQRQRVALGRAMVRKPSVFLMDEPLSNLDAKLRVETRAEIAQLHRRLGATFVYVTHDQVEAMTMSDRVALMMDGELLQVATPAEIYGDPVDLRVAEFLGTPRINVLEATVTGGFAEVAGARWPLSATQAADGTRLQLAIRPEWLTPSIMGGGQLSGHIVHLELLGPELLVHLDAPGAQRPVIARVEPSSASGLRIGQPLALAVSRVLSFDAQGRRLRDMEWLAPQAGGGHHA